MILATLCYVKQSSKTLMLHRIKRNRDIHQGKWNGLGGKLIPGETPEECVIREVREEAGISIKNPKLAGLLTFPKFDGMHDWYAFVFIATEFEGIPLAECEEGVIEWIPDERLADLPLWEGDRHFLKWIEEKNFFSGKFFYEKGEFTGYDVVFHESAKHAGNAPPLKFRKK